MPPEALFSLANSAALLGWTALCFSPLAPHFAQLLAGRVIPLALATLYTGLVLAFWSGAEGGFSTLPDVMALFGQPEIALAGWAHYLAFDLLVGAWVASTARSERIPHYLTLPLLLMTFLFGPAGFLATQILRASRAPFLVLQPKGQP